MKVFLGTDHAGFVLKEDVKRALAGTAYEVEDCGAMEHVDGDDYPDYVSIAAQKVAATPGSMGLVFGKSGTGEAIVANKVNGIRAALAVNEENVKLAREHNDANVLSIGSILTTSEEALKLVSLFLQTQFSGDHRHQRRIDKITQLENT